ncbi:hypothetical protein M431DRAFT_501444 [Trichoderma harzianum CBS 226.95]|uniref:Secreted protein n=1 Tax=Trichoderma harzianum CBS 226.95 TaxID=983964 RepID=A0A2T3ZTP5_TRIHA|nr:hypothetical protein M431DRAFT_501444 [Trichoderma harzianum CBS 226.95]PTB48181.1 hypothetical protein M431DRAFT_501444 [Trichoderma harzianum CBS 226.95]
MVFASITAGSLAVMPVLCFACFGADDTGAGQSGCSKASLTMHMYICYNAELVTATIPVIPSARNQEKRSSSISKMNRGPRHIPTRAARSRELNTQEKACDCARLKGTQSEEHR